MRTTVTLEPDVQALLREASLRSGKPFKRILDDAVRTPLKAGQRTAAAPVPEWPSLDMGAPLLDLTKAMALADELDEQRR
ncbi:MAG: hypothetical protein JNJ89_01445 [Rubrivivax sp.]|nr:hypothetical protein [Rubrivivax sp.]